MAHAKSTDSNVFILPDLGEGVHEAELIAWKVSEGDAVDEHQIIAEMETDKALVEVPSPRAGTIKTLHGSAGEILNVGNALVTYEGDGSDPGPSAGAGSAPAAPKPAAREDAGTVVGQVSGDLAGMTSANGKALATPVVRKLARDLGVDINTVSGTGIGGRVTKKDVEAFAKSGAAPAVRSEPSPARAGSDSASFAPPAHAPPAEIRRPLAPPQQPQYRPQQPGYPQQQPAYGHQQPGYGHPPPPHPYGYGYPPPPPAYGYPPPMPMQPGLPHAPGYTPSMGSRPIPDPAQRAQIGAGQHEASIPFRGIRRTIAEKLRQSVNTAVHFTVMEEADVTALDDLRRRLAQQSGQKVSYLPFVCQAVCRALTTRFGAMNARVDDAANEVVQLAGVHLGIATDTDNGLMVPVIPDAHMMDVLTLGQQIASTAASARDRSISLDRLKGSTFTISNVGSHAGKFATPIINYPEVAILAVGKVYDGVVVRDGRPAVGKIMPLSLACDHRVVDGATAALCLAEIVATLRDGAHTMV